MYYYSFKTNIFFKAQTMFLEIITSLLFAFLVWFVVTTYQKRRNMPPGPFPFPLIGNIPHVGSDPPFSMDELRKKYGDVYTVTFPIGTFVVVNSGKLAREALLTRKDDFAGRPHVSSFPFNVIFNGKNIGFADYGPLLAFRRKIVKSALHFFGEGINVTEERVQGEVGRLLERIEATDGQAFSPKEHLAAVSLNMMSEWLFSKRFEFTDPTLKLLLDFSEQITFFLRQGNYYQIFPMLKYLPTSYMRSLAAWTETRDDFFGSELRQHRETYVKGEERDIVDALLAAYDNEKIGSKVKDFGTSDDVKFLMIDVLVGAADTTISFLTWFVLYMKTEQEKVQRELDRVVGRGRFPCFIDAENLPYLQATICEAMRLSAFIPILLPHKAIRNSTIKGYHIPKDTTVLFNLWRIHSDPSEWENPSLFKPERFLDENGRFMGWDSSTGFLPFGLGRRACIGQSMGKMQVFIVASRLLHRFHFEVPTGEHRPSLDGEASGVRYPKPYRVIARKRL